MSANPLPRIAARRDASPVVMLDGRHGLFSLAWSDGVLTEIRENVLAAHRQGYEAAGILLGQRNGSTLQIAAFLPMWRSEFASNRFEPNDSEQKQLRRTLAKRDAEAMVGGLEPVGWFRARLKGQADLDLADFEFHEKFFPAPWQVAMGIRPGNQKPTAASLYMRNAGGYWDGEALVPNFVLPSSNDGESSDWLRRARRVRVVRGLREGARLLMPLRHWAIYLCSLILVTALAIWILQARQARRAPDATPLSLSLESKDSGLLIRWESGRIPRRAFASAYLTIGGERINLTEDEFSKGSFAYSVKSFDRRDLDIRLNAGEYEDSTQVIPALR